MVRWLRWHCPPDTGFEIRALAVWGRARHLSVAEAPHNTDFHTWMGKKHFCFFQTADTGNRAPNSGVNGSGANHYPRAPALYVKQRGCLSSCLLPRVIPSPVVTLAVSASPPSKMADVKLEMENKTIFSAVSMLGQRRRRWPIIETTLNTYVRICGWDRRGISTPDTQTSQCFTRYCDLWLTLRLFVRVPEAPGTRMPRQRWYMAPSSCGWTLTICRAVNERQVWTSKFSPYNRGQASSVNE